MSSVIDPGPGALFHTVQIDMDVLASTSAWPVDLPNALVPHATYGLADPVTAAVETLYLSDTGYVDESNTVYRGLVADAFSITRQVTLDPQQAAQASSWGGVTLNNPGGILSPIINARVNDHLPVRIAIGRKQVDRTRGGLISDPPSSALLPMFAGLGRSWRPDYQTIEVDLLDATYWLTATLNPGTYGGTGGLDGTADLAGRMKPMARGWASRITPVLIDATNLIYQVSNGPCGIAAIYEGGWGSSIGYQGQTSDIVNASVNAGRFVVQSSSSGTYIKLGSRPVYAITLDVKGGWPSGNASTAILDVVRQMLTEDLAMPGSYIDAGWSSASSANGFDGGWYWDGSSSVTGEDAIATLLSGLGIRLMPTRTGTLLPLSIAAGSAAIAVDADTIVSVSGVQMPQALDPPTWRWRVGYGHCFSQTSAGSSMHPQATAAEQAFIAQSDRLVTWSSPDVKARYRNPNDSDVIVTALRNQSDAQTIANRHGALWGALRRSWAIELPRHITMQVELGNTIAVTWPVQGLSDGSTAIVFGEEISSRKETSTLLVLSGNF